ncbi:MAG TPA: PQQ-dependent sugar dehydrogenase [Thermoanaerobaculia bacterium]|nr:PQQ-dependent sugar dehydrogenase [Thermoanaerobaculia bacterium]
MNVLALVLAAVVTQAEPTVALQPVTDGLDNLVSITHAHDNRLFITQQFGLVRIYDGTRLLPDPFLDVRHLVTSNGEQGLLSIAFHPDYAANGLFYVNYTNLAGHTVIARYSVSPQNPNRANASSAVPILTINQPFANHNGGQLQFGKDGYLYIGMGDGGSGGDPDNRAQNLGDLLGKMLRIDVNSGSPYAIPPSNPFVGQTGARPEIWSLGLRNPWRFSFDRFTGDLWTADVGQGQWEEINFQPATSIGGENYGWRRMEGTHCFNPSTNCNTGNLVLPVIEYNHNVGCSVTGGYVYRGSRYPRLNGTYLYGDFCSGRIWGGTRNANGTVTVRDLLDAPFNISTFGEDANGEVYVGDYGNGILYRITDARPLSPRRRAVRK